MPCLHRRAVALVMRMPDDARARLARSCRGVVRRAVVDDDDFAPGGGAARRRDTTVPMASASFIAGITIETLDGSANELLDDAVHVIVLRNRTDPRGRDVPRAIDRRRAC